MDNKKLEEHDRVHGLGVYKMIGDIHDEDYRTPLKILSKYKQQ
jgi:hypothetical protein